MDVSYQTPGVDLDPPRSKMVTLRPLYLVLTLLIPIVGAKSKWDSPAIDFATLEKCSLCGKCTHKNVHLMLVELFK